MIFQPPIAKGSTSNSQRRSNQELTPLSKFCYTLEGQRHVDIDMVGFDPVTNVIIWMIEEFSTEGVKTTSITEHIARKCNAYFIALKTTGNDFNQEKTISFVVRYHERERKFLDVAWEELNNVLRKIRNLKRQELLLEEDKIDYSEVNI